VTPVFPNWRTAAPTNKVARHIHARLAEIDAEQYTQAKNAMGEWRAEQNFRGIPAQIPMLITREAETVRHALQLHPPDLDNAVRALLRVLKHVDEETRDVPRLEHI